MMISLYNQDVRDFLQDYTGPKFNFALYDPPYEMKIVNKGWDNSGVVFDKEYNKLLFDAMLPGAFVLCYGHARVFHRVMVALEDAGFIVHKSILAWAYSSGQPQGAANIKKNIDSSFAKKNYGGFCSCDDTSFTKETTGYVADRFAKHAKDVDVCTKCNKVKRNVLEEIQWSKATGKSTIGGQGYGNNNVQVIAEAVTYESEILDGYTYGLASFKPMVEPVILVQKPFLNDDPVGTITQYGTGIVNVHDTTYSTRWPGNFVGIHDIGCEYDEAQNEWNCVATCELHQEYLKDKDFFYKYVTFAYNEADLSLEQIDKIVVQAKPNKNERHASGQNIHPTIKPIQLNTYFGKLFLPPSEFDDVFAFAPFVGSGSEVIGLRKAGWKNIVGVEREREYFDYATNRIEHFTSESCDLYEGEV